MYYFTFQNIDNILWKFISLHLCIYIDYKQIYVGYIKKLT